MWIPKWERDRREGVDSPVPTQAVSNEEFVPRPQNAEQKKWETLIGELADEKSKKLGMDRRDFLRSSIGMGGHGDCPAPTAGVFINRQNPIAPVFGRTSAVGGGFQIRPGRIGLSGRGIRIGGR